MTVILGSLHMQSQWAFLVVAAGAYIVGLLELGQLLNWGVKTKVWSGAFSLGFLYAAYLLSGFGSGLVLGFLSVAFVAGSVALLARKLDRPHPMAFLGLMWLLAPLTAMCFAHIWWEGFGPNPVAHIFLCLWGADTAALLAGKGFGRHPFAPSLSPGKTWEGSIAGVLAGCLVGVGFSSAFDIPLAAGAVVGLICGGLGLAGDLFESFLKRRQGVKDSGGMFPGHGGMLDRIDSLIMAAIPAVASLLVFAPSLFHVKHFSQLFVR